MTEPKKEGFFKRLFGSKKPGCCGVQIEEIKEEGEERKGESNPVSGCCSDNGKEAR